MKQSNALIGWFLICAVLLFYLYGVCNAISLSWNHINTGQNISIPEGLDAAISSINALLLTNLGAVLGISVTMPNTALSRNVLPSSTLRGASVEIKEPMNSRELIQLICLIIFLIALLGCFITWIKNSFESTPQTIAPYVSQSAKMFIGVILAYLSFILGSKQANS